MIWAVGYGIAVCLLGLIVWASHDRTTRIMSAILGAEWLIQNAAVDPDRWRMLNPASIATIAGAMVAINWLRLPVTALTRALLTIYALTMLLDVVVAFSGATTARWYFDAVNGTFALRLLIVGGFGVWCCLRHWSALGADRPLGIYPRRATLARRRPF